MIGLLFLCFASLAAPSAEPVLPQRVAVVVGANAGFSGGAPLRYAHADAQRMAETLIDVGGFTMADTHVLLDPDPDALLAALDAALAAAEGNETLLLFYYSGHADDLAVYPHGKRLSFDALRERIEDERASVRVGIIDACRGGTWTGTKGLTAAPAFAVPLQMGLSSTGSVLVSSSSGSQSAHETEAVSGSLFTHHLVAGLRGGADEGGDGVVSLGEAFAYAKQETVRDAVLYAGGEQHPSFHVNLRGRQDLVLARIEGQDTLVEVQQAKGPLQLIDLSSGVTILELQEGTRATRLALAPGRYLLRRATPTAQYAASFRLAPGERLVITEDQLELVASPSLVRKGSVLPTTPSFDLPRGHIEVATRSGILGEPSGFGALRTLLGQEPVAPGSGMGVDVEVGVAIAVSDSVGIVLPGMLRVGSGPVVAWGGLRSLGMYTPLDLDRADGRFRLTTSVGLGLDAWHPVALKRAKPYASFGLLGGIAAGTVGAHLDLGAGYDHVRVDAYGGLHIGIKRLTIAYPFSLGTDLGVDGPIVRVGFGTATPGGMRLPAASLLVDQDLGMSVDLYQGGEVGLIRSGPDRSSAWVLLGITMRPEP